MLGMVNTRITRKTINYISYAEHTKNHTVFRVVHAV